LRGDNGTGQMASRKKLRIAAVCLMTVAGIVAAALWVAMRAARQVRPFYRQAIALERDVLERGREELESRATTLYSDVKKGGAWQAVFTSEQVNGWLATQLSHSLADGDGRGLDEVSAGIREPRIAISPGVITLGFTTTQGGVEMVVSVDADVFLTEQGDVAVRLVKVQAGTLPLPLAIVADELAAGCKRLSLPVLWTENDGQPVAMIHIGEANDLRDTHWQLDSIELADGELFVTGHTDDNSATTSERPGAHRRRARKIVTAATAEPAIHLEDYELRLSPRDAESMLEVVRRGKEDSVKPVSHKN
jgi:hypothetical protein